MRSLSVDKDGRVKMAAHKEGNFSAIGSKIDVSNHVERDILTPRSDLTPEEVKQKHNDTFKKWKDRTPTDSTRNNPPTPVGGSESPGPEEIELTPAVSAEKQKTDSYSWQNGFGMGEYLENLKSGEGDANLESAADTGLDSKYAVPDAGLPRFSDPEGERNAYGTSMAVSGEVVQSEPSLEPVVQSEPSSEPNALDNAMQSTMQFFSFREETPPASQGPGEENSMTQTHVQGPLPSDELETSGAENPFGDNNVFGNATLVRSDVQQADKNEEVVHDEIEEYDFNFDSSREVSQDADPNSHRKSITNLLTTMAYEYIFQNLHQLKRVEVEAS